MRAHLFLTFAAPLALAGCLQDFGAFTPSSGGSGGGGSGGAGGTGGGGSGNQGGGGTGNQGGGGTGNQGGGGMASCGDGTVNGTEDCDGADLGGATCASQGFVSGALACSAGCTFDTSGCVSCGNGTIEGTDACDGANLGGETCISQGFDGGTLACSGSCTFDTSGCGTCGNDVQEGTEPCDGVDLAGETCVSQGFVGGTLACNGACAFDTSGCTSCGNGTIQAGEACDGNNLNGGTCASLGFVGGTLACAACAYDTSGCTNCGNGTLDAGEACDGANLNGATCASQGFASGTLACTGACAFDTSACVANPTCGNGVLEAGEACDDANMASNDGCSSGCAIEQPPNCTLTGFFLVPNGTLTLSGDTAMGPGTAPSGSCKGAVGGTRDVFALKPTANGFLTLTLPRAAATFDSVLSARTTCDSVASQVLCADSTQAAPAVNGGEMISFEVTANTIYYVVVESAGAAGAGTYDLTVDLSAGTCADPVEIVLYPPTPMVAIGNSTGDGANHQGSCGGMSAEEVTYRVRRSAAGPVTGALSGAHNLVLHARDVCADFNTEVGCSNGGGAGVTETLGPFAFPDANADAFFHCDGSGGEEGPYTLTLTP